MLSPKEVAQYHETGQVTPVRRLGEDVMAAIREKMEALFEARPDLDQDYAPNLIEMDRGWLDYAACPDVLDAAAQLIGDNIIVTGSSFFCKKGTGGKATPWHQDAYYWPMRPLEACTVWIAIDPSTPENGCLRIIPGSHKERRLFSHLSSTRDENVGLEQELSAEDMPDTEPVDVILEPGMMSFHHPYVVHGAEPNNSGARRGGLTFRYMPTSSYYDREIEARQGRQGVAFNADRQLHLVRGIDVCGRNDIYRPVA